MENFSEIISSDKPVLVDFYASWCTPCRTMHPILDEVQEAMRDTLRIIRIDIDHKQTRMLVRRYNIRAVPTLILFRRGEELWRQSGVVSSYKLEAILKRYCEEVTAW